MGAVRAVPVDGDADRVVAAASTGFPAREPDVRGRRLPRPVDGVPHPALLDREARGLPADRDRPGVRPEEGLHREELGALRSEGPVVVRGLDIARAAEGERAARDERRRDGGSERALAPSAACRGANVLERERIHKNPACRLPAERWGSTDRAEASGAGRSWNDQSPITVIRHGTSWPGLASRGARPRPSRAGFLDHESAAASSTATIPMIRSASGYRGRSVRSTTTLYA